MMSRLTIVLALALVASACQQTQPAAPAENPPAQVHANLAQLMRAIPFTFSNIIFDAQSNDPGAPREPNNDAGGATEAFKNVYGGWQEVENSALALSESAALMLVPGRSCENGKPVPVHDETFRKAAQGLVEAGRAAYQAAQTKNLDKMIEVSETVSLACSNCHEPYRDFDDPKDRCTPREAARASE